jgi:hypothetical protein
MEIKTTGVEKRLLTYKDEQGMGWKDICKCFLNRTAGALAQYKRGTPCCTRRAGSNIV